MYTIAPASRRSWRIGQTEPVQVVFMAYRNTLQADALQLVAKKLQRSLAVEGELPEDGLAAYGDDGDDLMLALARKIDGGEEDAGSVESVFEQARQVAADAEALLVDEGSPFTWSHGESLDELARPERVEEIQRDHEQRIARIQARTPRNPLPPTASPSTSTICTGRPRSAWHATSEGLPALRATPSR